jgi:hypothetical protein
MSDETMGIETMSTEEHRAADYTVVVQKEAAPQAVMGFGA